MLIPFCLWMKILLMELAFESHRSVGQTKIDGLGLSTCHQYRHYLENKNATFNREIELLQRIMTTQVALCFSEALALSAGGGPVAFEKRMRLCNLQLLPFERAGKALIKTQELSLKAFIASFNNQFKELLDDNRIDSKLEYRIPKVHTTLSALKRKALSLSHQSSENIIARFGRRRHWPRIWIANHPQFSHEFSIKIKNHMRSYAFEDGLSLKTSSYKMIQESDCSLIEKKLGYQYEVKR